MTLRLLAQAAERQLFRAPFPFVEPRAGSSDERKLRGYLRAFGIPSPPRAIEMGQRAETLLALLSDLNRQSAIPSQIHLLTAPPAISSTREVRLAVRRLRRKGVEFTWTPVAASVSVNSTNPIARAAEVSVATDLRIAIDRETSLLQREGIFVRRSRLGIGLLSSEAA